MKKNQADVYPLTMNVNQIFALFDSVVLPTVELLDSRSVILFKVDSLRAMLKIERFLLRSVFDHNPGTKGVKLISNKRKTLFLKASIIVNSSENEMWRFRIYQENSQGIIIETSISLDSYPDIGAELSVILIMMTDRYYREKEVIDAKRKFANLESKLFLLTKEDLEYLWNMGYLISSEKNQVFYTFDYYKSQKDMYPEMIESLSQSQVAIAKNAEIQVILDLCKECFEKFDFWPIIKNPAGCGVFYISIIQ